ncbi:insulinase family protein [Rubellimicrobium roseum]|uniref:Peptidase M16C associated domain-containing protein n=1 Tax=Rubellimicrobium roseum TaxID=687525 RepID=A0A5C4NE98_9RHOB|nr:insulinase family protein [Rubellimicrobium roseum]TNC72963.1 hypothetical protein FHG71_06585 [Rubellimicrobium roseum]
MHRRTGAEIAAVENADRNNVFAITFATLPGDDTGVAHVLEHLVFRGSQGFPLARPFAGLLQGSMQTYLNATTGPDRTTFHLASQSAADLRNLVDVTLDAVLRPLLRHEHFEEEAWNIVPGGPGGEARLGGIVLNEMRGHYAAPVNALAEELRAALLPGTVYARSHGGRPERIPDLTHRALVRFHRGHYYPSNARIFLWGDGDVVARLDGVDRHLAGFGRRAPAPPIEIASEVHEPCPKPWAVPEAPVQAALGWRLPEGMGPLDPALLALALVEMPGAPLAEALREAGLCLWGAPVLEPFRRTLFRVGVRETTAERAGRLEAVVLEALDRVVRDGVPGGRLSRACDRLDLALRESADGPRPRGLVVLERVLNGWRHGGDPLELLDHGPALAALRARLEGGPGPFRDLVRGVLLENPSRVTILRPAMSDAGDAGWLADLAARLSVDGRRRPIRQATVQAGTAPDGAGPGLPMLSRADLPREVARVPVVREGAVLCLDLGEPRVVRLDLSLDLGRLPPRLLGLTPFLGRWLTGGGSGDGLSFAVWSRSGPHGAAAGLTLRGKALAERAGELASRMAEMVVERPPESGALPRLVAEEIARQEARLLGAGHQVVDLRLRAGSGPAGAMADRLDGLGQLAVLRGLGDDEEALAADLSELLRHLRAPARLTVGLTGTEDLSLAKALLSAIAVADPAQGALGVVPVPGPCREGHVVASPVQAVGRAADLRAAGLEVSGATAVGMRALATGWLWDRLRVAGGAYGATAVLDAATGVASLLTARDPHLLGTLDAMAESGGWLRREASDSLLERCRIGAVAALDRPMPAEALMLEVLQREGTGWTDERRQAELEEVLGAELRDLHELADALDAGLPEGPVAVLGSRAALEAALAERPGFLSLA